MAKPVPAPRVKTRRVQLHADHPGNRLHAITTLYIPDESLGRDDAGNAKRTIPVAFLGGHAEVEEPIARLLKDKGLIR